MPETQTVLHVSAHPDDELTGAPVALFALRDAGFAIDRSLLGPPR
jgi:LmbE family N-acetylglucosaminyl deacetylase